MKQTNRNKDDKVLFQVVFVLLVTVIVLLATSITWFKNNFEGVDFSTILFTLTTTLEGSGNTFREWFRAVAPMTITVFVIIFFFTVIQKKVLFAINIKHKRNGKSANIPLNIYRQKGIVAVLCMLVICTEIGVSMEVVGVLDFFLAKGEYSTLYEDYYVSPSDIQLDFPKQKRNLILIYLEAMDTAVADITLTNGKVNLIPELEEIANQNVSFSNTDRLGGGYSCFGTDWTMGGLLASSSGVPFDMPLGKNKMSEADTFLPGLVTLGDILEEQGYQQTFMCGSVAVFGGRELFFTEHGKYEILDSKYASENNWVEQEYYNGFWGIEDEKLYEFAKKELLRMAAEKEPFNFTFLTVDTHFEEGYVCTKCENTYVEQYANVYRCASKQLNEFLKWIQQQEFYENTTVVILGDHNCMNYGFTSSAQEETIRTYNAFINSVVSPNHVLERQFTTMDYFPTILASMGVEIEGDRIGLGTNLFSDEKTLPEKLGMDTFETDLQKNSLFYATFYIDL